MKRLGFFITCFCWVHFISVAQNAVQLVSSTQTETVIRLNVPSFTQKAVNTDKGVAYTLAVAEGTPILKLGAPDLPKFTTSLVIPDQAVMQTEVVNSQYVEYNLAIAPSKGNLTRDINPSTIPYTYASIYQQNAFFPNQLVELRNPHIVREHRGQTVVFYPYQYNPITQTLRVYTELVVKVSVKQNYGGDNPLTYRPSNASSSDFDLIYNRHFLNYGSFSTGKTNYVPVNDYGKMLVICHDAFVPAIQPYLAWKKAKGIRAELVLTSTTGTSASSIKMYIQNYYNMNANTFVVLVGDNAQVPAYPAVAGASDNTYTYVVGADHYPDIFVGRFSGNTVTEIQTQVNKTIDYEKNPTIGAAWYKRAMGIGSDQGPGDDNEMDFEHERNIRTKLLNFTYNNVAEVYDGSQGGVDAAGNPSPIDVQNEVNTGVSLINYTGHGSSVSFGTSGYSNTDINACANGNKLPIIFSVACVNGDFTTGTCFAETWLRKANGGAAATLMSTINQSWNPPMEGQDEFNDILTQQYSANRKFTFGGLAMNGCMKMNDTYGTGGEEMTDTWTIFGDPSLSYFTDTPSPLLATHVSTVPLGTTALQVNSTTNGAFVSLTFQGEVIGTGFVSAGTVNIAFSPVNSVDTIKVTVTAFNKKPYFGNVLVVPSSGPYVSRLTTVVNDATTGNNNGLADFAENFKLNMTLKNYGTNDANAVNTTLSSLSSFANITTTTQAYGTIVAGASVLQNAVYGITLVNNVPDQTVISLNLNITDNLSNNWNCPFTIMANAPKFDAANALTINDAMANNNHRLDAGENGVSIVIPSWNVGHAESTSATATLSCSNPNVTMVTGSTTVGLMNTTATYNPSFTVNVSALTPKNSSATFTYTLTAGAYSLTKIYTVRLNMQMEDFETNTLTLYPWTTSGNANWFTTNQLPYEGAYCSESGDINDNEISVLELVANVATADSISFYRKTSSEEGYDYLEFYIDGAKKDEWSGLQPWEYKSYGMVNPGVRTFKWVYMKDYIVSANEDCAWIDDVVFPPLSTVSSIKDNTTATGFNLYPNPMQNFTTLSYQLHHNSVVNIQVYDLQGKKVITLKDNENQIAGNYNIGIHANVLPSGTYLVYIQAGTQVVTQKMVVTP